MSFITRFCSTLIHNGMKTVTGSVVSQNYRNFHMMLKPLPTLSSCISKTPTAYDVSPTSLAVGMQRLLTPVSSVLNQVAGFKVKGRLKRRCKDCYFVIRQQRHYVICPTHRRHKQMSMKKRDYKSWILTHATQSKVRPY